MDKSDKICVVGGDLRIAKFAELLSSEKEVKSLGFENHIFLKDKIKKCSSIREAVKECRIIISGIPLSEDGILINAPHSDKKILIDELFKNIKEKTFVAGAIKQNVRDLATKNNIKIVDLMENEFFTILNVIPTVEGAIQTAMENTAITINNSNCLILGFGRIGKALCKILKSLGANVSAVARKDKDIAWIKLLGYKDIYLSNLSDSLKNKYDIIFNTIPSIILKERELKILKENNNNCIIIELASKPGGIDLKEAEKNRIKVIYAQGLPGKVAPNTAAKYIKETLEKL